MISNKSLRFLTSSLFFALLVTTSLAAQDWKSNPRELVRQAVQNENKKPDKRMYFMFRDVKTKKNGQVETKEMLETPELTLGRLIAINGHPLTPAQEAKEDARLNRLTANTEELAKKKKSQQADEDRAARMVNAIPDAFNFQYVATEKRADGKGAFVVLKFSPNPKWDPPNRELQVFTGMQGMISIAVPEDRIALMDATLFRSVNFGWGIFGRLDAGGSFLIQQAEVYPGYWDTTHMKLHFTGKILLFKSLNIQQDEKTSDYHLVNGMTVAEALNKLKEIDDEYAKTANGK